MSFGQQMKKVKELREELDPADYTLCCEYYCGPNDDIADAYSHEEWPWDCDLTHMDLGDCDHCGTAHFYGAVYRHTNGDYLAIGNQCAGKFFDFTSRKAYLIARAKRVKVAREKAAEVQAEAEAFVDDHPGLREAFKVDHHIVQDIESKLFKWGSISEKQVELVIKIAKDKAAEPKREPIPTELLEGRHEFVGVILGFKKKDTKWGVVRKMVFLDDRGFTLFGATITTEKGYDRGDRVSFYARVTVSERDNTFGFYTRPSKATVS